VTIGDRQEVAKSQTLGDRWSLESRTTAIEPTDDDDDDDDSND